jgi:hypothetical protein
MEQMANQMVSQYLTNMIPAFKAIAPDASESEVKVWLKKFQQKFQQKFDVRALIEIEVIPIWDKYYTVEDLKAINAFYESAVGQRLLAVAPMVSQEAVQAGMEWGAKIGKETGEEIAREMEVKQK